MTKQRSLGSHKIRLQQLIAGVTSLPTLPQVVTRVNSMLANQNTTSEQVGDVISADPVLTLRILKMVNSAFYSLPNKIARVHHAISILGFNTTRSILMTTSVIKTFNSLNSKSTFDLKNFWIHSLGVATAAKALAIETRWLAEAEDLYVAGLLHDIGKVVLTQFCHEAYDKVLLSAQDEGNRINEMESEQIGFSHEEVGGLLAARWDIPSKIVAAISTHHEPLSNPDYSNHYRFISVVHVADVLCKMIDIGSSGDNMVPVPIAEAFVKAGITPAIMDKVLTQLSAQRNEFSKLFDEIK